MFNTKQERKIEGSESQGTLGAKRRRDLQIFETRVEKLSPGG
jgi:hypothetical protein